MVASSQHSSYSSSPNHRFIRWRAPTVGSNVAPSAFVTLSTSLPKADEWAGLKTIIRVRSYRHILKGEHLLIKKPATRYYISSLDEPVEVFAQRIREYWHVENKVHYVRDVTQGEDASRIRVQPLPNLFALGRNLALNLYRDSGFENMAQAQRRAGQGLDLLKALFRMK